MLQLTKARSNANMNDNVKAFEYLSNRSVTRLCHFTKVRSLSHILTNQNGILATQFISDDRKHQNDAQRLDNSADHVCCSLQYPNCWYWKKSKERDEDAIFKEWVVLCIDLEILKAKSFKFSPCNAAKGNGSYISSDITNISSIFATKIDCRTRTTQMLQCCPTDDQAEILLQKNIPLQFVTGIIVGNNESANNIGAILKTVNKDFPVLISPDICDTSWSNQVRVGQIPLETEYNYRGNNK
jgi:hypothetical protein